MLNATCSAPTDKLLTILNAALAQLVERDLAKVEVTSSSLVCRSNFSPKEIVVQDKRLKLIEPKLNAVLAQLVERDLAKVEVTSSSLVYRSNLIYFPDIHSQIANNNPYANHYKFNLCNFLKCSMCANDLCCKI